MPANNGKRKPAASRLDRLEAAQEKTAANLDRLVGVVNTLAASVAAHDGQIEQLTRLWAKLRRDWQAYLTTIHPRQ